MSVMTLEQGLRNRLWVIDMPLHLQREFLALVLKWYQSSGVEWTIGRLKSLKVDLYRRRAGLPSLTWVRKNRKGDLAGCLGGMFRWADKSDKNFRKVVQTLMCYTVWKYSKPTDSQVKKFTSALSAPPPTIVGFSTMFNRVKKSFGGLTVDRSEDVSLLLYRGSSSKRKPSRGLRSIPQDSDVLGDAEAILSHSWGIDLVQEFQVLFNPVLKNMCPQPISFGIFHQKRVLDPWQIIGGKIAFLQEPGGKLRSVASPFLAYQLALRHFGKRVYELARHLPWDCTHDQSVPIPVLQEHLKMGKTVHSVDLSSATDYFPLEVQVTLMRSLFGNLPDISLFEILSKSTWSSPIGAVRWTRGQPLGLYPSFAVFTVSHGLLLWYLNGCQHGEKFFVLGDDVVILDDDLYHRYIAVLQKWGCPYSREKSLSSNHICEFAGKVITSKMVMSQYKWREMSNDNFVDIARQLGHRSRILLSSRQRLIFDKIKHLTEPFGLNFSFPGSNLVEMERLTASVIGQRQCSILESLVDQRSVLNKNLYGSTSNPTGKMLGPTLINHQGLAEATSTFDEKVRFVLRLALPWFSNQDPKLFASVPDALGISDLPPVALLPSRATTLDRYSRLLLQE